MHLFVQCEYDIASISFPLYYQLLSIPIKSLQCLWKLLELYWTPFGQAEVWSVGRGLAMYPRLAPVVGQHLSSGEVDVHGEQAIVLAVVDMPLLPGHVPPPLPSVHVQPVRSDQARHVGVECLGV